MSDWQTEQLIELARRRYEHWDGFAHPQYVADEITPKRNLVEKAKEVLNLDTLDRQLNQGKFEAIVDSIQKLTRRTNLLWRRVPGSGDTAVLQAPNLNKAQLSIQIRNLLYGDRSSPERLQTFSDYLDQENLPNKWPFPTFLLFITHPESEMFVKPRPAQWYLKFVGLDRSLGKKPNKENYAAFTQVSNALLDALKPLGATDMIDVQSLIWIGMKESKKQVGSLDKKSQIYLDVPPTTPAHPLPAMMEKNSDLYHASSPTYTVQQMVAETGYSEGEIQNWLTAVNRKGQAIFYGPPGTGKTFVSQKLGKLMTQGKDGKNGFCETIQFHPAYTYEDFIEGLRPLSNEKGTLIFEKKPGHFLKFCQKAQQYQGDCVLIIDEINRANLASVIGELMYLLEYRSQTIQLANGTHFNIPENVKLIATMNSADRSLALVDFALRRRFAFIRLDPRFDLIHQHPSSAIDVKALIKQLKNINSLIGDSNYALGHTYFLIPNLDEHIQNIWEVEIMPYLQEYFFDSPNELERFQWQEVAPFIWVDSKRN